MLVVAVTFIGGFLLGEAWRFFASRHANRGNVRPGIVGEVGTYQIPAEEYRQARDAISRNFLAESLFRDLTSDDESRIDKQAWDKLTSEHLWRQVLTATRLRMTEAEMNWLLVTNPPEWAVRHPELQTDGQFDTSKYVQLLQNPRYAGLFAGHYRDLYEQRRQMKLQIYALSAYRPVGGEAMDAVRGSNSVWSVTALYFPRAASGEPPAEPTEAELKAYYRAHRDEFRVPKEIRELRYVSFPVPVTAADTEAARQRIFTAHARLLGAADTASLHDSIDVAMYTDADFAADTASEQLARSSLEPAVDTALRRIKPGRFTGPLPAANGFQIVILDSSRADTVWVRRIRTRIRTDNTAEIEASDRATSFIGQARATSFDSAAIENGLSIAPVTAVLVDGKIAQAMVQLYAPGQLEHWARIARVGEVIEVPLRGPGALHVFELARVVPAGVRPWGDEVRERAYQLLRQQRDKEFSQRAAQAAVAEIRQGKSLEQYAAEHPEVRLLTDEVSGIWDYVTRSERGVEFVGAAIALEPGQTTGPVEARGGAYIIRCDRRAENQAVDPQQLTQQKAEQVAQAILQSLWQKREVRDYRMPRGY